jgi:aspartokinase
MKNINKFLMEFNSFLQNTDNTFSVANESIDPEIMDYIVTIGESYSEKMMCMVEENQITSVAFIDTHLSLIIEACLTMGFLLKDKLDRYKLDMLLNDED